MNGDWAYRKVPLETGNGAPCSTEGGFKGSVSEESLVAICCANHCGKQNDPTISSSGVSFYKHDGTWPITNHGGARRS